MTKKDLRVVVADYSQPESEWLSLDELCEICDTSADFIDNMIAYAIIHPQGRAPELRFSVQEVQRAKKALRLQRDLEINLAGIALAFDLLEKIDAMDREIALIEKHYSMREK